MSTIDFEPNLLNNNKTDQGTDDTLVQKVTEALYANNILLNKERNRINKILLSVAEIIFAIDQDYKITLFNQEAELVFGKKFEEVSGKPVYNYIHLVDDKTKERIRSTQYAFADNNDTNYERIKIIAQDQETQYYKLRSSYIDQGNGIKEAVIALSNITNEVEVDKQKDEFISIASHELKTPISITRNNLWMFNHVSKKKFSKREQRFLDEIDEGISRLQKIVNNLLDISRIQQGRLTVNFEETDLYEDAMKILINFKDMAEEKKLKLNMPEKLVHAIAQVDKERYSECIENLVGNAFKYTQKGEVTVKVEDIGNSYKFSVSDTGPGIPEKDYQKIFTKFGRASEGLKLEGASSSNSTGLGLYITKNYVQAMGGKIGFNSTPGKGTTFWFTIPKKHPIETETKAILAP